jgi:hypothetical protein
LAYQRYLSEVILGDTDSNPYLAYLAQGEQFEHPSSRTFDLSLRSNTISEEEIQLPVVNIHILPGQWFKQWIFDYTILFTFNEGAPFSYSSNTNGVRGIILNRNNWNYSGICVENRPLPPIVKPDTNAVLTLVTLEFATHDDNKHADTRLNVHIVNRLNKSSNQDIAIGLDLLKGEEFPNEGSSPKSYKSVSWSEHDGTLASNSIRLQDIALPVVNIIIIPNGDDRWIFDYRITFEFSDLQNNQGKPQIFSSRTNSIILDQDNNKYSGVYQGNPFPVVAPATAPALTLAPIQNSKKKISLSFLKRKFDEFINFRQGQAGDPSPYFEKGASGQQWCLWFCAT